MSIVELIILFLVIIGVIAAYFFLKTASHLIVNTVLGLILLAAGNLIFKIGIAYTIPVLLVVAFGGIPGAILVILLHQFAIAF